MANRVQLVLLHSRQQKYTRQQQSQALAFGVLPGDDRCRGHVPRDDHRDPAIDAVQGLGGDAGGEVGDL